MKYPTEVQTEVFDYLIHAAKGTAWGKQYRYDEIKTHRDFAERVPLQTYEEVKPFTERLKKGETNLLWPGEINWFAKSSGTTNDRSKFIPVSREALEDCHYKGGKDLLAIFNHNHPENTVYDGKSLVLGGSSQINTFRKDSYYGDLSAIIINNLPLWVEFRRIPEKQIALMDGWEEKIDAMAHSIKEEYVTSMSGVPSWMLVLLRRMLEITGKAHIGELWPDLQLYMHGGVNFGPYRDQFKALIPGDTLKYYETYNASEGFFGLQDLSGSEELLLLLDYGIYYEFIPAELSASEQPPTYTLSEVEIGKNYEMVISTNAGLWRYRPGDTVTFTSLYPFRIKITGRTKHFINAFGEELIIDNAEKALAEASRKCNAVISEYTAGPIYMDHGTKGGHEWLIEFERKPASIAAFGAALDEALKSLNSDYDAKRTGNLTLNPPLIKPMPEGTFYRWMKKRNKLGGQNKVPRLCNHRDIIEDITAIPEAV